MQRQRGELVPIGEVVSDLDGPVQAIRDTLAPGAPPLHPGRPGEPACLGQRLFLAGSGFAESVVQSDVNVAAHDVIIFQFVSRLKVE